jgi:hypothetical protein
MLIFSSISVFEHFKIYHKGKRINLLIYLILGNWTRAMDISNEEVMVREVFILHVRY